MKYTIYWCDNKRTAGRGANEEDTFYKKEFDFNDDREALLEAAKIQDDYGFDESDYTDYSNDDIKGELELVDDGAGFPVVFWVERNDEKIYDSGYTRESWMADYDNEITD